jgi:hypothetical protein
VTNFFVNGGDGLTTGYWAIAPWARATSYPNGSYVRQRGGQITIGVALDFTHSKVWFKDLTNNGQWNDSATDDPGTNTGGISNTVTGALFPAVTSQNGTILTANFGATSFVGSLPSGFSSVNTANGSAVTWDPSNKATRITLSGSNLVAQSDFNAGSLNTNYSVRATARFNSGLVYFEVTFSWGTASAIPLMRNTFNVDGVIGAVNSTFAITTAAVGSDANGVGWVASTGFVRINNATVATLHTYQPLTAGNERVFKNKSGVTITSGSTQPSWSLTSGATTSDNGGTWTEVTGSNAEGWNAPFARMETAQIRMVNGDVAFVGDNHTQCMGNTSLNLGVGGQNNYLSFLSVNHSVSSPGSGDLLAGATVYFFAFTQSVTSNFLLSRVTFQTIGTSTCVPTLGGTSDTAQRFDNCTLTVASAANNPIIIGGGTKDIYAEFNNCTSARRSPRSRFDREVARRFSGAALSAPSRPSPSLPGRPARSA